MVVCAAGYGKSTNLEWLAAMLADAGQVPFLFPLDHPDLPASEKEFWKTTLLTACRDSNTLEDDDTRLLRALMKARQMGRITLLLDSIDQATPNGLKLLRSLVKSPHWTDCPMVVSARPHAVFKGWKWLIGDAVTRWRFVRVEPLAQAQSELLLGPDGVPQDERRAIGAERYARLPEAGRHLMANPRHIDYVRKCIP
jgi:hypothetical protein